MNERLPRLDNRFDAYIVFRITETARAIFVRLFR